MTTSRIAAALQPPAKASSDRANYYILRNEYFKAQKRATGAGRTSAPLPVGDGRERCTGFW